MKIELIKKTEIGNSKINLYYTIEDVITLYDKQLIDRTEARFMISCITKHSYLMEQPMVVSQESKH